MTPSTKHRLADRVGLPVEVVRSAAWWLEWKAAAISRTDGKWLSMTEQRMARGIRRVWKKQQSYLLTELKRILPDENTKGIRFLERKALNDELKRIMDNLPEQTQVVAEVKKNALLGLLKGGNRTVQQVKLASLGISFNVKHPDAVKYLSGLEDIHLSQRYGSINLTTRKGIIDIVKTGVENGDTYTSLAKKIQEQGIAGVFSPARAEMIAVNQMAKAYETGKAIVANEAQAIVGEQMMSYWQTVEDDRVTPECAANEDAGWLPKDTPFPSGDMTAPRYGNPRCRCAMRYDFVSTLQKTGEINQDVPTEPAAGRSTAATEIEKPLTNSVQALNGSGSSVSVPVNDGHVYHATPVGNLDAIAKDGLQPRVSRLDEAVGDTPAARRVYFGVNPAVTGTGVTMDTQGDVLMRVRADAITGAHLDPHIPNELSVFVTHGIKPSDIEVQDEFGQWVPLLQFIKTLSS